MKLRFSYQILGGVVSMGWRIINVVLWVFPTVENAGGK